MEAGLLFEGALIADDLTHFVALLGARAEAWAFARAAESRETLNTALIESPEDLALIGPEWESLEQSCPNPVTAFQSFAFQNAWAQGFHGKGAEMRFVIVRDKGRLVLVWPLAIEKSVMGLKAGWSGAPIAQYGDVVMAPGAARAEWLEAASREIASWGDISYLDFSRVRADAAIADWLTRHATLKGEAQESPVTQLSRPGFDAAALVRNEKRLKRLKAKGEVSFELVEGAAAQPFIAQAFAFKNEWAQRKGLYGGALADERVADVLSRVSAEGGVAVTRLAINGETAAIEIGFRQGGHHYAFMGAFAPDFAKMSPGHVLTELTIRRCAEDGLKQYDPLPPNDAHKKAWSNASLPVRDYGMVLTARGMLAHLFSARLRPFAKRVYESLPLPVRRALRPAKG